MPTMRDTTDYRGGIWEVVRRSWQWLVILALAVVSFWLGFVGFWRLTNAAGETIHLLNICYLSLQLFTLESGGISGIPSWELQVARYLAPLVPAWTIVKAFAVLFHEQLLSLRMRFLSGHVVICGLGRKGLQLAKEFRADGHNVVVIDQDEDNARFKTCRDLGVLALVGNAADKEVLRKARAFCAKHVIAVCTKDGKNVEIAVLTRGLIHEHNPKLEHNVQCSVHIIDLRLCALFKQHPVFTEPNDLFEASVVNIYVNVARSLLEDHPLERTLIDPEDPRQVHLIILGFGHAGESTAIHAAGLAHYANGKRLKISVVDANANAKKKNFYAHYPNFDEVCDITFIEKDTEGKEALDQISQWANAADTVATILVALGSDSGSVIGALNVLSSIDGPNGVPILVRVMERVTLASLLSGGEGGSRWVHRVHPVGMVNRVCTERMFLNKELDLLARAIHEAYVKKRTAEGESATGASLLPWERLDQTRKDSNRKQADHIPVKLRAIGCKIANGSDGGSEPFAFTRDEVELLARMEHARWRAHRYLTGWISGPTRDSENKESPHLGDWPELPEEIKQRHRDSVHNIPGLLGLVDKGVERV
ncbi:NAD-binding protein [Candidatus Hydrogenedentota bacterium]